jgi:hypothetical protein
MKSRLKIAGKIKNQYHEFLNMKHQKEHNIISRAFAKKQKQTKKL